MRFFHVFVVFVVCWASGAASSSAAVPLAAEEAYALGQYARAAGLAEREGSAASLAFAARAYAADGMMRSEPCHVCFRNVERTARLAIKQNSKLAEAYVQLAIAIGFRGRFLDAMDAQSEGLAEAGRQAIDQALAIEPENPWALATLGGWHLEIVSRGGTVLARVMFDASERAGLESFRRALARNPRNLYIQFHFALAVLALDSQRFRSTAMTALNDGLRDPDKSALANVIRIRAEQLRSALGQSPESRLASLVKKFQFSDAK